MGENTNSDILDLGGRGDTNGHVTASQNWIENKPKMLLWHTEAKKGVM